MVHPELLIYTRHNHVLDRVMADNIARKPGLIRDRAPSFLSPHDGENRHGMEYTTQLVQGWRSI